MLLMKMELIIDEYVQTLSLKTNASTVNQHRYQESVKIDLTFMILYVQYDT